MRSLSDWSRRVDWRERAVRDAIVILILAVIGYVIGERLDIFYLPAKFQANYGDWKLDDAGYCTTWKGGKANCFTVVPNGQNKWSVMKGAAVIAVWSK